jgi:membrane protein YqaA with SNARE-associated domain
MTGSSSKLLQIQGKWYQERKQKKQNLGQKKQKLFYTLFTWLLLVTWLSQATPLA